jgi:hypothetical protein
MTTKTKVLSLLGLATVAGLVTLAINRKKQDIQNIIFGISFNRIHGLIGEGVGKFLSPKLRIYLNVDINNQSNNTSLTANNIFVRFQSKKAGATSWDDIALSNQKFNIVTKPGANESTPIALDFKGIATIASLANKTTKHRVVYSYTFLGQPITQAMPLQLNTMVREYLKPFLALLGLSGVGEIEPKQYTPYTLV